MLDCIHICCFLVVCYTIFKNITFVKGPNHLENTSLNKLVLIKKIVLHTTKYYLYGIGGSITITCYYLPKYVGGDFLKKYVWVTSVWTNRVTFLPNLVHWSRSKSPEVTTESMKVRCCFSTNFNISRRISVWTWS